MFEPHQRLPLLRRRFAPARAGGVLGAGVALVDDRDIEVGPTVVGDPFGLRAPDEGVVLADVDPEKGARAQ